MSWRAKCLRLQGTAGPVKKRALQSFKKPGTTRPVTHHHMSQDLNPKYKQSRQFSVETSDWSMLAFGAFMLKSCKNVHAGFLICVCLHTITDELMH